MPIFCPLPGLELPPLVDGVVDLLHAAAIRTKTVAAAASRSARFIPPPVSLPSLFPSLHTQRWSGQD